MSKVRNYNRNIKPYPGCTDKVRYSDELLARAAGMFYKEEFEHSQLYLYKCKNCNGFHITKKKPSGGNEHMKKWRAVDFLENKT
jgi:hypothetical protein